MYRKRYGSSGTAVLLVVPYSSRNPRERLPQSTPVGRLKLQMPAVEADGAAAVGSDRRRAGCQLPAVCCRLSAAYVADASDVLS